MNQNKKPYNRRKVLSAIQTCFKRLDNPNVKVRLRAVRSLGNIAARYPYHLETLQPLLNVLERSGQETKLLKLTGRFFFKGTRRWISADDLLQETALISIGKACKADPALLREPGRQALLPYLNHPRLSVTAGRVLGELAARDEPLCFALLEAFRDLNSKIRREAAAHGLGFAGLLDPELAKTIVTTLLQTLGEPRNGVKALVSIGKRHPNMVLAELRKIFCEVDIPQKQLIALITTKIVLEHPSLAQDYLPIMFFDAVENEVKRKGTLAYRLGVVGTMKPELVKKYLPIIFKIPYYASSKAIRRITSADPWMVLEFLKEYDFSKTTGSWSTALAHSLPEEYLKFLYQYPNQLSLSIHDALVRMESIPENNLGKVKDLLHKLYLKNYPIPPALARHPLLLEEFFSKFSESFIQADLSGRRFFIHQLNRCFDEEPAMLESLYSLVLSDPYCLAQAADFVARFEGFDSSVVEEKLGSMLKGLTKKHVINNYFLKGLSIFSRHKPEMVLEYLDPLLAIDQKTYGFDKYCLKYQLLTLGNLVLLKRERLDEVLRLIIPNLDYRHFRGFDAAEKALKTIALAEPGLIPQMRALIAAQENETISRRGLRVLRTVERRVEAEETKGKTS